MQDKRRKSEETASAGFASSQLLDRNISPVENRNYTAEVEEEIARLRRYVRSANPDADLTQFELAITTARNAHASQRRKTGEPYILHPLSVAIILTDLDLDLDTLSAALLHDTVEDTNLSLGEIRKQFGDNVADIVDGVTKLEKMSFTSQEELQAENFRKMFLAMAKDIRVVLVKLADRLHNMRTMKHLPPGKQAAISRETLDIYAPLADRLGVYRWKWELEDLCLRYIDPEAFYELVGSIAQKRGQRERFLERVILDISRAIEKMGIDSEVEGRPKHFYSIYRKMKMKDRRLEQIYDLFACRIIVNTVADCYAVLGLVHEMYHPMSGRFKDYIAVPKPNHYQSLHTTVFGPGGFPFEIQIRTHEMHRIAELGIAAHWKYKAGIGDPDKSQKLDQNMGWLKQLLDWQKDLSDSDEFMASLKTELVADEVFVFTPVGDVISLPMGSVPIDFAYSIHSGVGNHMYAAKVNGNIVSLDYELQTGDIVEILTSERVSGPSHDWLKLVKSGTARNKINHFFKQQRRSENVARGRSILEEEIRRLGFRFKDLVHEDFYEPFLERYSYRSLDDLYAALGVTNSGMTAQRVAPRLRDAYVKSLSPDERSELGYYMNSNGQLVYDPEVVKLRKAVEDGKKIQKDSKRKSNELGIEVDGIENCKVMLAQCCSPVPGDAIIGFITRGRGVTVHRQNCSNIRTILERSQLGPSEIEQASRLISVRWDEDTSERSYYPVDLRILAHDRSHLFADISSAIGDEHVTITAGSMSSVKDVTATLYITIEVNGTEQANRVIGRIRAIPDVLDVKRGK